MRLFIFSSSYKNKESENYQWKMPSDEWDAMCISYTSGTTGKPKGVIYHHRGAYLMAMGTIPAWNMQMHPTYLYIVPLFHCNGWGHAWMMAILAGTTICCRKITAPNTRQQILTVNKISQICKVVRINVYIPFMNNITFD